MSYGNIIVTVKCKIQLVENNRTWPDLARPAGLKVGPRPDLAQWTRRHWLHCSPKPHVERDGRIVNYCNTAVTYMSRWFDNYRMENEQYMAQPALT